MTSTFLASAKTISDNMVVQSYLVRTKAISHHVAIDGYLAKATTISASKMFDLLINPCSSSSGF